MIKSFAIALALCAGSTLAFAAEDEGKPTDAEMAKVPAALTELGCKNPESVKREEQVIYEIDDAQCKMGVVAIKLDKDFSVILISRY